MLPFNRFPERDLNIQPKHKVVKYSGRYAFINRSFSKHCCKIMNFKIIMITYKLRRVGGKVNGIGPSMWLLLRSLRNGETRKLHEVFLYEY